MHGQDRGPLCLLYKFVLNGGTILKRQEGLSRQQRENKSLSEDIMEEQDLFWKLVLPTETRKHFSSECDSRAEELGPQSLTQGSLFVCLSREQLREAQKGWHPLHVFFKQQETQKGSIHLDQSLLILFIALNESWGRPLGGFLIHSHSLLDFKVIVCEH